MRQAGQSGLPHRVVLLAQLGRVAAPLAQTHKGREAAGRIYCRVLGLHFLFSKIVALFTQAMHLLPVLLASCEEGAQEGGLCYLLRVTSLLICLEGTLRPRDLPLLTGEHWGTLAWPVLCLLEAAPCPPGREESITNSSEISALELWLPSN